MPVLNQTALYYVQHNFIPKKKYITYLHSVQEMQWSNQRHLLLAGVFLQLHLFSTQLSSLCVTYLHLCQWLFIDEKVCLMSVCVKRVLADSRTGEQLHTYNMSHLLSKWKQHFKKGLVYVPPGSKQKWQSVCVIINLNI